MPRLLHTCLLAFLFFAPLLPAQTAWTLTRLGLANVNMAKQVAFGNGRFVVTCSNSTFGVTAPGAAWSTDGTSWRATATTLPNSGEVIFASGAFYLSVGNSIWRSTDGDNWEQIFTNTARDATLGELVTDGRAALSGTNSLATKLLFSPDLLEWRATASLPGSGTSTFLGAVTAALGRYYVQYSSFQPSGSTLGAAATTTDGSSWTTMPALAGAISLAGNNDRLIAVLIIEGYVHTAVSTDGIKFVTTAINGQLINNGKFAFAGGRFFFLGSLTASIDGAFWAPLATAAVGTSSQITGIAYGNGRYVAVGFNGAAPIRDVVAVLSANAPPVITAQPLDRTVPTGGRATFSVAFDNPGLVTTFQWLRNGSPIAGATSATYVIDSVKTTDSARYSVTLRNPLGTATSAAAALTLALPPTVANAPVSSTINLGATVSFSVSALGSTPFAYQWLRDGTALPGATSALLTIPSAQTSDAGSYTVNISNSAGSVTTGAATLTLNFTAATITSAPTSLTVVAGAKSTLSVTPTGTAPFTYQWFRNGLRLSGATAATLTFDTTLVSDAGTYSVIVTNPGSSVSSPTAILTVTPVTRLSNLSVLTSLSTATDTFTLGYVVGGGGPLISKPFVLRAVGPSLAALGVTDVLPDPHLQVYAGTEATVFSDNWNGIGQYADAFAAVGAFPFISPGSKDAGLIDYPRTRDSSIKISSATPGIGLVLAEIYDATPTDTFTTATPRLLNVSVLKPLGTGLTVGFTLAGTAPKTILIRAIGPTLGDFGVPGTVADPQLALFNSASTTPLASNDNWSVPVASAPNATALTAAFSAVGAFTLPATSKDAALLTTLPPGGYSVQVSGVNNTTGAALVEVYEIP
jgi:hypothetical protein